jgi:predicted nucleotidyltransferase
MALPKTITTDNPEFDDWNILTCYRGSIAHGMYIPKNDPNSIDDKDVMVVCAPPKEYYLGLKQYGSRGTREIMQDEWDVVIYEARKALSLLAQGNPNVLAMLWLEDKHYISLSHAGKVLLENRELFSGRHVYRSFVGYGHSQLKKMTATKFEGYMGEKRKRLVQKFGYDTKNAAHLIRLLRMGIEFLKDGRLYVERHDAPQLLEIKRGAWTLEQVKQESDRLFISIEDMYINSDLPEKPDKDEISKLCAYIVELSWQ